MYGEVIKMVVGEGDGLRRRGVGVVINGVVGERWVV